MGSNVRPWSGLGGVSSILILSAALTACQKPKNSELVAGSPTTQEPLVISCQEDLAGIVGGQQVNVEESAQKHVVLLAYNPDSEAGLDNTRTSVCSGTLISPRVVLTAAHCMNGRLDKQDSKTGLATTKLKVHFSVQKNCSGNQAVYKSQEVSARFVRLHPEWNPEHQDWSNSGDLALVYLDQKAPKGVVPVRIASKANSSELPEEVLSFGYGVSSSRSDEKDKGLKQLRKVVIPVLRGNKLNEIRKFILDTLEKRGELSDDVFNKITKYSYVDHSESEKILLDQSMGQGLCSGDSGGPSFVKTKKGYVQLGIASAVFDIDKAKSRQDRSRCAQVGEITNLVNYAEWIKKNLSIPVEN